MHKNYFDVEYAHSFFKNNSRSSSMTMSTVGADDLPKAAMAVMETLAKMHSSTTVKRVEIKVNNNVRSLHGVL